MDNKRSVIVNLIKSFFVTYAWMNIGGLESTNILLLCVFFVSFILLKNKNKIVEQIDHSVNTAAVGLGIVFTVFYALYTDLTGGLENKLFIAIYAVFSMAGLFVMFYEVLSIGITKALGFANKDKGLEERSFSWKVFLGNAAVVFVCCIPFLVLNYPAIMTTDSLNQFAQVTGVEAYVDHHPWIHTMLLGLLYKLGYAVTGDVYASIAFYTIFQIVVVSLAVGYAVECFYEMGLGKKSRIALMCCFVLIPYNLIYSVTIWKDIIFSMAVLVLTVTLMRIVKKVAVRDYVLLVISATGMCVLRHNGFYAYIATAVVLLLFKRKEIKKYIIPVMIAMIIGIICRGPLMSVCGVEPGENVFNFNIPLQQVGRVVADEKNITDKQIAWLENINSIGYIKAGYSRDCTDNMTAWVLDGNTQYFDNHHGEFIKLWLEMGIKYPVEYVRAFVDTTKGYWAPMSPQQTVYYGIAPNSLGLEERPLIAGPVQIKINELLYKLYTMFPIYGFFYSMGGFFWLVLIAGAICIIRKDNDSIIVLMPVLMLTLTLFIATPMVADLRYSYALLVAVPYIVAYILKGKTK